MNLMDGGMHRQEMKGIGLRGLKHVLKQRGKWEKNMSLDKARDIMWEQPDVKAQLTRIEQLCFENGIVALYEPKAHPVLNKPPEVSLQ
jgi:hypothetical protein